MNNIQSLQFIYPELILALFSFMALMGGVGRCSKNFLGTISFLGVVLAAFLFSAGLTSGVPLFFGMLIHETTGFLIVLQAQLVAKLV